MVWTGFVDLIYGVLACVSTALGGSMGWAIAVVSLVVRLLLLPLTLRIAYRGLETRAALRRLEPELARIRAKYKKDRGQALEQTALLYRRHGVKIAEGRTLLGTLVQAPIFLGLFGAIRRGLGDGGRFLWVKNIAVPDVPLAVICSLVTALSARLGPEVSSSQRALAVLFPAALTLFFLSRLAAGLSIYALTQGLVGVGQSLLVRRRARQLLSA